MNALIVGQEGALQHEIVNELKMHEYDVMMVEDRTKLPVQDFDICVDMSAGSISDVKLIAKSFKNRIVHYILVSSCRVYPPVSRLYPWRTGEIDLCDDTGFNTVDKNIRQLRAAERELKHFGSRGIAWTILRPSIVEVKKSPEANNMWWFVSRILDGGPIVLPDDDDPLFRHVSDADLARAIRVVAGRSEAFFQTMHVTGDALLSFESYARLIMNVLNRKVPIVRVPGVCWQTAGLRLPMGKGLRSSFIEDSLLLEQLGWQPGNESEWVQDFAAYLVRHPMALPEKRKIELALLDLPPGNSQETIRWQALGNWKLVGKPGELNSFHLESSPERRALSAPLLRTAQLGMGLAEERFLVESLPDGVPVIMGHIALLELVGPGDSKLEPGSLCIPVAKRPCGDSSCAFCADHDDGIAGITDDGFGTKYVSVPARHLITVPGELEGVALLADPLACLLSVLPSLLDEASGPVWVFGERIDALLAALLIKDAGKSLLHVGRTKLKSTDIPIEMESVPLQKALKKVEDGSFEKTEVAINLSGTRDGENILARALSDGGFLVTPFSATQARQGRVNVRLPLVSPGRLWLEQAIELLEGWSSMYDLASFLRPMPLECFHEMFISGRFIQSFVDFTGEDK